MCRFAWIQKLLSQNALTTWNKDLACKTHVLTCFDFFSWFSWSKPSFWGLTLPCVPIKFALLFSPPGHLCQEIGALESCRWGHFLYQEARNKCPRSAHHLQYISKIYPTYIQHTSNIYPTYIQQLSNNLEALLINDPTAVLSQVWERFLWCCLSLLDTLALSSLCWMSRRSGGQGWVSSWGYKTHITNFAEPPSRGILIYIQCIF